MRKVFLDDLPKWGKKGMGNEGTIDWSKCIGYSIKFIYDDIEGTVEILDYDSKARYLYLKYLNNPVFKITVGNFTMCGFSRLLGIRTNNFKIEIGTHFKNDKRDIIIINREYKKDKNQRSWKYYNYSCNKCGWTEGWAKESNILVREKGCSCCSETGRKTIVLGFNTIWDTDRWMCDLGVSEEDAKINTIRNDKKIKVICPDCKREKWITTTNLYRDKSIHCICGDKKSYAEKLAHCFLEQIKIEYIEQYTPKWTGKQRYDFYIPSLNVIIETHGMQHYENSFVGVGGKTVQEEQSNDKNKQDLAIINGVKEENYIVIDCKKSELEFIKQNILNSKLSELFDLSDINWLKAEEFALSNRVKEACNYFNNGIENLKEIGLIMKLDRNTITRYLKKGAQYNWCNYDVEIAKKNNYAMQDARNKKSKSKPIMCLENKMVFKSIIDCERRSEEVFGSKLDNRSICAVLKGKRKMVEGYTFKYVSDLPIEQQSEIAI